jgi:pimeloyl-ACP methyl ester carboxylesterase
VLAVVKTLGRDKAMISGESLGGWVATYLAAHRPAAVEKLVLNTAAGAAPTNGCGAQSAPDCPSSSQW